MTQAVRMATVVDITDENHQNGDSNSISGNPTNNDKYNHHQNDEDNSEHKSENANGNGTESYDDNNADNANNNDKSDNVLIFIKFDDINLRSNIGNKRHSSTTHSSKDDGMVHAMADARCEVDSQPYAVVRFQGLHTSYHQHQG